MTRADTNGGRSQLRIIGGNWRGRKLLFIPEDGLRPTSDRIRETLFNWLAPNIHQARCADLFAGSGALGMEALSRGAASCDFVDISRQATQQIDHHLQALSATNAGKCHTKSANAFLQTASGPYDIVFLDPPFKRDLVSATCRILVAEGLLAREALIYVETASNQGAPDLPDSWRLHREKVSGGVAYRLYAANG